METIADVSELWMGGPPVASGCCLPVRRRASRKASVPSKPETVAIALHGTTLTIDHPECAEEALDLSGGDTVVTVPATRKHTFVIAMGEPKMRVALTFHSRDAFSQWLLGVTSAVEGLPVFAAPSTSRDGASSLTQYVGELGQDVLTSMARLGTTLRGLPLQPPHTAAKGQPQETSPPRPPPPLRAPSASKGTAVAGAVAAATAGAAAAGALVVANGVEESKAEPAPSHEKASGEEAKAGAGAGAGTGGGAASAVRSAAAAVVRAADRAGEVAIDNEDAIANAVERAGEALEDSTLIDQIDGVLTQVSDVIGVNVAVAGRVLSGLASIAEGIPILANVARVAQGLFDVYRTVKLNARACAIFASRVENLMTTLLEVSKACGDSPPPQLEEFHDLLVDGLQIVKQFRGRGFLSRLLKGKNDVAKLEEIDEQLTNRMSDMQMHVLGASLSMQRQAYDDAKAANAAILAKLDSMGGARDMGRNDAAVKEMAAAIGVPVEQLKQEVSFHLEQLLAGQQRLEERMDEGPHLLITNPGMQELWRRYLRGAETVTWETFEEALKSFGRAMLMDASEVDNLVSTSALRKLLDVNGDGYVSAIEVSRTFNGHTGSVFDTIRSMVRRVRMKDMPPRVSLIPSREALKDECMAVLCGGVVMADDFTSFRIATSEELAANDHMPCRLLILQGPPACGKTSVAVEMLHLSNQCRPDRVHYVNTISMRSNEALATGIACSMGVELSRDSDPVLQLLDHIRELKNDHVVVLDGGEGYPGEEELLNCLRIATMSIIIIVVRSNPAWNAGRMLLMSHYTINVPAYTAKDSDDLLRQEMHDAFAAMFGHMIYTMSGGNAWTIETLAHTEWAVLPQLAEASLPAEEVRIGPAHAMSGNRCAQATKTWQQLDSRRSAVAIVLAITFSQRCFTAECAVEVAFDSEFVEDLCVGDMGEAIMEDLARSNRRDSMIRPRRHSVSTGAAVTDRWNRRSVPDVQPSSPAGAGAGRPSMSGPATADHYESLARSRRSSSMSATAVMQEILEYLSDVGLFYRYRNEQSGLVRYVTTNEFLFAAKQQVENNPALVEMKETMLREAHYRYISLFSRTIASVGVMYESANVARARHLMISEMSHISACLNASLSFADYPTGVQQALLLICNSSSLLKAFPEQDVVYASAQALAAGTAATSMPPAVQAVAQAHLSLVALASGKAKVAERAALAGIELATTACRLSSLRIAPMAKIRCLGISAVVASSTAQVDSANGFADRGLQAFKALTDMHKGQIKKHMYTFCVLLYAKILCLVGKRDFSMALAKCFIGLNIIMQAVGTRHPWFAMMLSLVGQINLRQGQLLTAREMLRSAANRYAESGMPVYSAFAREVYQHLSLVCARLRLDSEALWYSRLATTVMPLKQQILFTTLLSGSVDTMNVLSSARGERSRMKKRRWKKQTHVEEACSSSGAGVMLM